MEIWKAIPDFENYAVSNLGNVKRVVASSNQGAKKKAGDLLYKNRITHGYYVVSLFKNGKRYDRLIHRLVAENFVSGYTETKKEVNHKDGDKANNTVENLEWVTRSENMKHSSEVLQRNWGEKSVHSKITDAQAIEIVQMCCRGIKRKEIAAKFGICVAYISHLYAGRTCRGRNLQPIIKQYRERLLQDTAETQAEHP